MIIWLASYPKSGNTWIRSFLVSLLKKKDAEVDINDLEFIRQYPLRSDFSNLSINIDNIKELSKKWIESQNIINSDNKIKILKTHYALCNLNGNFFTNYDNTLGAIYIIRDPRNIVTSIKHYYSEKNINEALNFILDDNCVIGNSNKENPKNNEIITPIASWKTHYNSWKLLKKNFLLVKYEDLMSSNKEFFKITEYIENHLKIKIKEEKIFQAIKNNSFEKLKQLEKKYGFRESEIKSKKKMNKMFFNLGPQNDWKKLLEPKIARKIEKIFQKEMIELGYI